MHFLFLVSHCTSVSIQKASQRKPQKLQHFHFFQIGVDVNILWVTTFDISLSSEGACLPAPHTLYIKPNSFYSGNCINKLSTICKERHLGYIDLVLSFWPRRGWPMSPICNQLFPFSVKNFASSVVTQYRIMALSRRHTTGLFNLTASRTSVNRVRRAA